MPLELSRLACYATEHVVALLARNRVNSGVKGLVASLRRTPPMQIIAGVGAILVSLYVIVWPFLQAHYPPITDLPFHGAASSILRHYFDPDYHFREQFIVEPFKAPYWTIHGLAALLALFMPIVMATKVTAMILLGLLPAGLAVMFHGMKKSPLLGLLGLPFVWNTLTHWGFINFMGALGLFAAVVGFTLLVVDKPTQSRQIGLAVTLFLVFATHIFRFPFAMAAVVGTAIVMYPATGRFRPILAPMIPSVAALFIWLAVREKELSTQGMEPLRLHPERFAEIRGFLFGAFTDPAETLLADRMYWFVGGALVACIAGALVERRWQNASNRDKRWTIGVAVVSAGIALVFLTLYLVLPMQIGIWWYVYPREVLAALFIAVGLSADLPRSSILRYAILLAILAGAVPQASFVAKQWAAYDSSTRDFEQITRQLPPAPKLGYLVWDRHDYRYRSPTFIHLPAWVQAEKGGWLSFHFVEWNAWPIRYRKNSPDVPPLTPPRFEWTPERFDLASRGKFFDWFLVRRSAGPDPRFARQPDLKLVDHVGTWWLYHREKP